MEINDMKIFYTVANLNSTTQAAENLGFVQSHISKRISKLEEEFETKLFFRSNKGMSLTEDGALLLPYVDNVLSALNDIDRNFKKKIDVIKVGASHTIAKLYLQDYYLQNDFKIETVKFTDDLIKLLENNSLDFILTNRKIVDSVLCNCQIYKEPIVWAKSSCRKDNLLNVPILISDDKKCPYRQATLNYLKEQSFYNNEIIEVESIDIAIEMIMNNKALGIVPKKLTYLYSMLEPIHGCELSDVTLYIYKKKSLKKNIQFEIK